MNSEEDDDEELLQRALAEQAQRDQQQYKRPPQYPAPAFGVTGVGGPPRRTPPQTPPNRAPPKPPPIEDEEESDVELLSISSEDEDAPPPARRMSGSGQKTNGKGRARDESDLEWDKDDEEPDNWTLVDQVELVRRVREMRETRSAAVAHPPARLRRATTMVTDAPRGEDLIDPLGLGNINIRTLTLVKDEGGLSTSTSLEKAASKHGLVRGKDSSSRAKDDASVATEDAPIIRDPVLREKVMYHSEHFDAKFFLARIHQNSSAAELETGEHSLKLDLQNRKDQLKKLVKENFDCFISCKNTIDDIHSKLQQIEADPEGAGTIHLSNAIQNVDAVARRAFGPLLERQAQAERIRSVQGMLQRFRTLFNLPSIIRGNISKGDYDLAIREYQKAKSLVLYSHVGILSRVLEEVDKIVQEFRDMLYKTMEDPNVETSQLENTIRLLLELEPDSDPVWHYLSIQDRKIRGLLEGCALEHEARMDALHGRVREKVQSDARWKQLQRESNKASEVDFSLLLGDQDKEVGETQLKDSTGEESDALLGRLIRRLTAVIVQHVPSFWRLALSIFSGKFAKVTQPGCGNGGIMKDKVGSVLNYDLHYPFEELPDSKYTTHSLDEVVTMVHCIISLYESKIQTAFVALAEANVLRPYMRDAVLEISKACVSLQGKDSAPPSAVQALLVLRTEVTRVFVLRLCTLMRGATAEMVYDENWVPVPTVERNNTPFAISGLPLRFQDMLITTMEHMTEMIQNLTSATAELHEDMAIQVRQMQDNVRFTFFECFLDLAECLEKLAGDVSHGSLQEGDTGVKNMGSHGMEAKFAGLIAGREVSSSHQRLLMVLSNIGFCKNFLLPDLSRKYQPVWSYSNGTSAKGKGAELESSSTAEEALNALTALEDKVLNQYNFGKATLVSMAAASYLLDDTTQWASTSPIKGVRDNVVELLYPLIAVHAEVYAGAKPFLEQVITVLVEGLMEALLNVFNENKNKVLGLLDINGYCQLMLEIDFLETVLQGYLTGASHEPATGLRELLLGKVLERVGDQVETSGHRRNSRGSDDGVMLDDRTVMSPDDVQALALQVSADLLPSELRRVRINVICFADSTPEINADTGGRRMAVPTSSFGRSRASVPHGPSYAGVSLLGRHLRKSSGSSPTESDHSKVGSLPPLPGSTGSELGSEASMKAAQVSDRYTRLQGDARRASRRTISTRTFDTDLL